MKKKLGLSSIILLCVVGLVIAGYFLILPKTTKSSQLSDRAKEFMTDQKRADSEVWRNVVTTNKTGETNQEIRIEGCYAVTIPFVIKHATTGKDCVATISIENGGTITLSLRTASFADLDESPDILFRKTKPDLYKPSQVTAGNNHFETYTRTDEGYEKTGFAIMSGKYLTVSLVKPTNETYESEFKKLLESIELL